MAKSKVPQFELTEEALVLTPLQAANLFFPLGSYRGATWGTGDSAWVLGVENEPFVRAGEELWEIERKRKLTHTEAKFLFIKTRQALFELTHNPHCLAGPDFGKPWYYPHLVPLVRRVR